MATQDQSTTTGRTDKKPAPIKEPSRRDVEETPMEVDDQKNAKPLHAGETADDADLEADFGADNDVDEQALARSEGSADIAQNDEDEDLDDDTFDRSHVDKH